MTNKLQSWINTKFRFNFVFIVFILMVLSVPVFFAFKLEIIGCLIYGLSWYLYHKLSASEYVKNAKI